MRISENDAYHDVVKVVPRQFRAFGDHGCGDKGRQDGSNAITGVKKAEDFIWVRHVAYPGVPRSVCEAVAEACKHKDDDQDGVRWVNGDDDVGN